MNKGSKIRRKYSIDTLLSLSVCCLLFFSGCGLDEYYVVAAPYLIYNQPTYSTTDFSQKYFDFYTNDTGQTTSSDFDYLGTAVYYKIFNNYSTMATEYTAIIALNSSTTYSAAADKMIDTYGYKELSTSSGTPSPLLPDIDADTRVYIRLMNYQDNADYAAKIIIGYDPDDDAHDTSVDGDYVPRRNLSKKYTFDFGREDSDDTGFSVVPDADDDDVTYSSSFSDDDDAVWYVDVFAVAVGRDTTYTKYYSTVLHLGSIAIDSSDENN
ncbi:MAG TPA: hypothetical protein DCL73_06870 [Treponema sp.]|nr:hypothetical protein [Treponema sp.]